MLCSFIFSRHPCVSVFEKSFARILRIRLVGFVFEVQHRSGSEFLAVRALSRLRTSKTDSSNIDNDIPTYENFDIHTPFHTKLVGEYKLPTKQLFLAAQNKYINCKLLENLLMLPTVNTSTTNFPFDLNVSDQAERHWMFYACRSGLKYSKTGWIRWESITPEPD